MKFKHGDIVDVEGYLGEVIKVTESILKYCMVVKLCIIVLRGMILMMLGLY